MHGRSWVAIDLRIPVVPERRKRRVFTDQAGVGGGLSAVFEQFTVVHRYHHASLPSGVVSLKQGGILFIVGLKIDFAPFYFVLP